MQWMARLNGWYTLNVYSILFLDSIIINWTSTIHCRCEIFHTNTNGTQHSMENVYLRLSACEHTRINFETNESAYEFASFHHTSHFDGWPFSFENNHNRFAICCCHHCLLSPYIHWSNQWYEAVEWLSKLDANESNNHHIVSKHDQIQRSIDNGQLVSKCCLQLAPTHNVHIIMLRIPSVTDRRNDHWRVQM